MGCIIGVLIWLFLDWKLAQKYRSLSRIDNNYRLFLAGLRVTGPFTFMISQKITSLKKKEVKNEKNIV